MTTWRHARSTRVRGVKRRVRIGAGYRAGAWDTRAPLVTSGRVGMKLRFSLLGREGESLTIFVKPSSTSAHSAGVGGEEGVALGLVDVLG